MGKNVWIGINVTIGYGDITPTREAASKDIKAFIIVGVIPAIFIKQIK